MNDIVYLEDIPKQPVMSYLNKQVVYDVLWASTVGAACVVISWLFYLNKRGMGSVEPNLEVLSSADVVDALTNAGVGNTATVILSIVGAIKTDTLYRYADLQEDLKPLCSSISYIYQLLQHCITPGETLFVRGEGPTQLGYLRIQEAFSHFQPPFRERESLKLLLICMLENDMLSQDIKVPLVIYLTEYHAYEPSRELLDSLAIFNLMIFKNNFFKQIIRKMTSQVDLEEDLSLVNEPIWIPRQLTHTDIINHVRPAADKLEEKGFREFLLKNYKNLDNYDETNRKLHQEYDESMKLMAEQIETWLFKVDDVGFFTAMYFWIGPCNEVNMTPYCELSAFKWFLKERTMPTKEEFFTRMRFAVDTIYIKHITE
jgi:hypothetical protein